MMWLLDSKLFWLMTIFGIIYIYLKYWVYAYWKRHGVPHMEPGIPLGDISWSYIFGRICIGEMIKANYNKLKQHPYHGFYALYEPVLVINDPELIRIVLVKEFASFRDRGWFIDEEIDPMSGHLFLLPGDKWKKLRGKLSPIFTSGRLKQMYELFTEVSDEMITICNDKLKKSDVLEMKDIIARYTTDIISSIVYGFNCNSLKNPKSEFRHYGLMSVEIGRILSIFVIFIPHILKKLGIPFFNKKLNNFFFGLMNDTMNYRRKEKVIRKDFLNLLMQLVDRGELEIDRETSDSVSHNHDKEDKDKLSIHEASAQAFVFFLAGYETSSSTATYCLYELAKNPDIQEKLQEEIDNVAETIGINYDSIMNMEYLDMVFHETLRKYPSLPTLNRICVEDFQIPDSNVIIPQGMRIIISISGIHHNPEYFPNPEKFDPERFNKENRASRSNYVSLGFGEGPRHCIGKRFGLMQTKQALVSLLKNYKFHVSEKTPFPVKYNCDAFIQAPEGGIHLRVEKRKVAM